MRSRDFRRSRAPTGRESKAKLYRLLDDDEGNGRWVRPRDFRHEVGTAEGHEHCHPKGAKETALLTMLLTTAVTSPERIKV